MKILIEYLSGLFITEVLAILIYRLLAYLLIAEETVSVGELGLTVAREYANRVTGEVNYTQVIPLQQIIVLQNINFCSFQS